MAKGNPSPKKPKDWDEFKKNKHPTRQLAKRGITVKFSVEVDERLRKMDGCREFIRDAVDAALAQEEVDE